MEELKSESADSAAPSFEIIKSDTIIDIAIGTGYYKKIQEATMFLTEGKTQEEINDALKQIESQNVTSDWVNHYQTLLIFCKEFESKAKELGHTQTVTEEEFNKIVNED
jgi:hypothetical protein